MRIRVMKFGGSSLAEPEKIKIMADRAVKARADGAAVVMVVSAPADLTDDLIALSRLISPAPSPRESDALIASGEAISAALMAMAVSARGIKAVSLSGAQAGIRTDARHGNAGIISIDTARLRRELKKGRVAVIAGFQGLTANGDTATLGRGGSDLTAAALAHALKAEICEFRTDVRGVYTANPALVPSARLLEKIPYKALLDLSLSGTEVRQFRAIAYAAKYGVPLLLRSSFEDSGGTLVGDFDGRGKETKIYGLSLRKDRRAADISIIGSRLDPRVVRKELASAAGRKKPRMITAAPGRIVLRAAPGEGEYWLKFLHAMLVERRPAAIDTPTANR